MKSFEPHWKRLLRAPHNSPLGSSELAPAHFTVQPPSEYLTEDRNVTFFRMLCSTGNREIAKWRQLPACLRYLEEHAYGKQLNQNLFPIINSLCSYGWAHWHFDPAPDARPVLLTALFKEEDSVCEMALNFAAVQVDLQLPAVFSWAVYEQHQLCKIRQTQPGCVYVSIFKPYVEAVAS